MPFTLCRDPQERAAVVRYQNRDVVMNEGEWSDWQPITFELVPNLASLKGMCRFYLKEARPHLKLYVSPLKSDRLPEPRRRHERR